MFNHSFSYLPSPLLRFALYNVLFRYAQCTLTVTTFILSIKWKIQAFLLKVSFSCSLSVAEILKVTYIETYIYSINVKHINTGVRVYFLEKSCKFPPSPFVNHFFYHYLYVFFKEFICHELGKINDFQE